MEYIKFYSTVPNAFTVTSGTAWHGVDENYMIDGWNVWAGAPGYFPIDNITIYLCVPDPLLMDLMSEEEINDYTTYLGGE